MFSNEGAPVAGMIKPAAEKGRKHGVHHVAGVIHFFAVVIKSVAHAVQRASVQDAVVNAVDFGHPGKGGEQINI